MQTKATFNGKPFQYMYVIIIELSFNPIILLYLNFFFRVSSVLNSDHSIFGKKHLFDGNEESAWNSEHVSICFMGCPNSKLNFKYSTISKLGSSVLQFSSKQLKN